MNFMNNNTNPIIIGIDHGYGNIKTAHCCFKTGVAAYDKEPTFKSNLLIYESRYYLIGEEHKEFISDKMTDSDYYILTLAAVARELNIRKLTSARVHLAAGLPLTWVSEQKDSFKAYLLQNDSADFTFKGVDYHVDFVGADIFPQGFSAVADKLREFKGINMLCEMCIRDRFKHLSEIDQACNERMETIVSAMAKQEGVTEALKAADQMEWVRRMNNIRNRAEEIILHELVYEESVG